MKKYEAAGATVEVHKLKLQDSTNKLKQMNKENSVLNVSLTRSNANSTTSIPVATHLKEKLQSSRTGRTRPNANSMRRHR